MSYEINYIDLRVTQLEEESSNTKERFEEIFKRLDEIEKQIRDMKGDQR